MKISFYDFFNKHLNDSLIKMNIYKYSFYLLNIASLCLVFYSTIVSSLHLAAIIHRAKFPELAQSFSILGAGGSDFPIITTLVSASSSLLTSLTSFFVMKERFHRNKMIYEQLIIQKILYEVNAGVYSDTQKKDYLLFEKTSEITGHKKYLDEEIND
ncbi:DUF4231 domain-containing protein [Mycoplasmopsis pulmonis]|uniref:DUF4231 domain-containing protein n=1 Tax=Mycoplasmopsis pulmonis TaxID=2107 RepID=UPI001004D697|nr:DUF4231 domain-containing protein [Mycoplasmopsis pulmonis]VEU67954.1 Uncharacterised protein [Mycoplasmopsis pulmonis]